jgi:isoleucyl-tRNA synthetase
MHVVSRRPDVLDRIRGMESIILDELNVKTLEYSGHDTALAVLRAKADFKRLGRKLGGQMKKVAQHITGLDSETIERLAGGTNVTITVDGETFELEGEDVLIERLPKEGLVVASEGAIVVALKTDVTPDLVTEGLAREFVNKVQNMRKTADFKVTQRIRVEYCGGADVQKAVAVFSEYICGETLTTACVALEGKPSDATDWDLNGFAASIAVRVV